jgi:N-acetylglucosaminyl-diphospho-decaprenol L-rhamnosyltransferase
VGLAVSLKLSRATDRGGDSASEEPARVAAVIVNYNAGESLTACIASIAGEGVEEIVVVDNASVDGSAEAAAGSFPDVVMVRPGRNLGYGAGANRGVAETAAPYLVVCNPDLVVVPGVVGRLVEVLEENGDVALVGPMIKELSGVVYPSGREFPSLADAVGHAFLGLVWGGNPWTRRYRHLGAEQHRAREADWVSGAFFLVRRVAFESVGGFDERYFMYLEDVDLCWRLHRAGWRVRYEPEAAVVHEQGRSASRHPYSMLLAHHVSMWRFARRSAGRGEKMLLPLVFIGLVVRLVLAWAEHLASPRSRLRPGRR